MRPSANAINSIAEQGFAVVRGTDLRFPGLEDAWENLSQDWANLRIDTYMADEGRYRLRRFGRFFFVPATEELVRLPHATVFQSSYINNFAGGIQRDFAPLREATFENPWLLALIRFDFRCFRISDACMLADPWEVWVHQIRIRTHGDISVSPAPEGVHHDGHDCIAMHLVKRQNVHGGQSVLYDNSGNQIHSCLLDTPMDTIYADDHRVMHAVGSISSLEKGMPAERDMLIIDFDHRPKLVRPDESRKASHGKGVDGTSLSSN